MPGVRAICVAYDVADPLSEAGSPVVFRLGYPDGRHDALASPSAQDPDVSAPSNTHSGPTDGFETSPTTVTLGLIAVATHLDHSA